MTPEVLKLFPKHVQYVGPFLGGGAIFFAKKKSHNEVINDLNNQVVTFYRVCQTKFDELQEMILGTAHAESEYERAAIILKDETGKYTDIEMAWAFWVQTNLSFTNKIFGGFAFSENGEGRNTSNKRKNFVDDYRKRLENVEIFQRDALDLIKTKDSPDTFFYCDPPYVGSGCGHYKGYTERDFVKLLKLLAVIKGRFLLSSYPSERLQEYRKEHGWRVKDIEKNSCRYRETGRQENES